MPKVIPVEEKRVVLNCLISPKTRAVLVGMDCSQGEAVDRCVVAWVLAQAQGRAEAIYTPAIEQKIKAQLDAVGPKVSDGRGKASVENWQREPLLKPKDRR